MERNNLNVVPILILAYNRPQRIRHILEKIKSFGIQEVYISVDGPLANDESNRNKVDATLGVIREYSKSMKIILKVHKSNLGCYRGVTSGINWFFDQVPHGIILEDDLDFDLDLLSFLSEQLFKYEFDSWIGSISGFRDERFFTTHGEIGQFATSFPSSWGWATWDNRWKRFESEIGLRFTLRLSFGLLKSKQFGTFNHWRKVGKRLRRGDLDSWAYRWLLTHLALSWKAIVPSNNLVTNLGFGSDATHTRKTTTRIFPRGIKDSLDLNPSRESTEYDNFLLSEVYGYRSLKFKIMKRKFLLSKK